VSPDYLCWLLGHGFDLEAAGKGDFTCPRCKKNLAEPVIAFDRGILPTVAYHLWHRPMLRVSQAWRPSRRCPGCGARADFRERCTCLPTSQRSR
jgi:hypothetical protein